MTTERAHIQRTALGTDHPIGGHATFLADRVGWCHRRTAKRAIVGEFFAANGTKLCVLVDFGTAISALVRMRRLMLRAGFLGSLLGSIGFDLMPTHTT